MHVSLSPTTLDQPLPEGSWDTHFHIFPPHHPLSATPPFTPPRLPAQVQEDMHAQLGLDRQVLVHSFVFGKDLTTLLEWLAKDPSRRAVGALTDEDAAGIRALHAKGLRGVRAPLQGDDLDSRVAQLKAVFDRLDAAGVTGWSVCVQEPNPAFFDTLLAAFDTFPKSQVLMIDHMGFLPGPWSGPTPRTVDVADLDALPFVPAVLGLMAQPNVYCKLSAPYRITKKYEAVEPLVRALAKFEDRIVWASDWPFVPLPEELAAQKAAGASEIEFRSEDMPKWISLLREWLGEELFAKMMVDNAAKLYA